MDLALGERRKSATASGSPDELLKTGFQPLASPHSRAPQTSRPSALAPPALPLALIHTCSAENDF